MAKLRQGEKRVQLSFQREDDLRLHSFMVRKAYKCRWDLPTFVLAALQDAFGAEMDNEEVDAVAEEAMAKVRERQAAPPEDLPASTRRSAKCQSHHHAHSEASNDSRRRLRAGIEAGTATQCGAYETKESKGEEMKNDKQKIIEAGRGSLLSTTATTM